MSSHRLTPPFRAEHIGSLRRPKELLDARAKFDEGELSEGELEKVTDRAVAEIVQKQKQLGIQALSDGEFRRHMFYDGFFDNLDGFKHMTDVPQEMFMDYVPDVAAFKKLDFKKADTYICVDHIKRTKPMYVNEFEQTKKVVEPKDVKNIKLTLAAPEWFHLRHGEYAYDKKIYKNDDEYFADITKAYREELDDLYKAGCRNIQFDDPLLAYFCAESMITQMEELKIDHEALLDRYIRNYNDIIKGRPRDLVAGIHLCRGNFKGGRHFSEGGYDRIAVKLFQQLDADVYYLEYDTERAGTFEPLTKLPKGKSVVLGLISSKISKLEDIAELKQKVHQAVEKIAEGTGESKDEALERICISPQCGFASHSMGNDISDEDVDNKLRLVVRAAQEIWGTAGNATPDTRRHTE